MPVLRFFSPIGFAVCLAMAHGCSSQNTAGTVHGDVSFQGQPLKEGTVTFEPVDGKSQTASATIKDGKFTATVPIGDMRVRFSAPKVVGKRKMYDTPDSKVVDDVTELIPARYNVQSKEIMKVESGTQVKKFDLK